MIKLNKVLPIKLALVNGKKIPIGGMNQRSKTHYTEGMHNFAIYMADYPDIIVLDLDSKDHPLKHLVDTTYTHETRKGWHLFFLNTYGITRKRQMSKLKFDLMVGDNWLFYDYNDPKVATYTEHNQLPVAPMPLELYDIVKVTAQEQGETSLPEIKILPLLNLVKRDKTLYDHKSRRWAHNSSELALSVVIKMLRYTDNVDILRSLLEAVALDNTHPDNAHISEKQYHPTATQDILTKFTIPRAKTIVNEEKVNWRPLDEYRIVMFGGVEQYALIPNRTIVSKQSLENMLLPGTKLDYSLKYFTRVYEHCEFLPEEGNKKFVGDTYNLFNGWIDEEEGTGHEQYLEFLRDTVCNGNSLHYDYLVKYMAHMVQIPEKKPNAAIVLFGPSKGTGKDTVHNLLGRIFLNGGHTVLTERDLFGDFNEPLATTLLGAASELVFGGSHKEDSKLKNLVTEDTIQINIKHKGNQSQKNVIRLFITSNSHQPVRATDGERRYFALKPSTKHKDDHYYWTTLYDDFVASNLLYFLRRVDLTGYKPTDMPYSEYLSDIVQENIDKLDEDIDDWLDAYPSGTFFKSKDMFDLLASNNPYMTQRKLMTRIKTRCEIHGYVINKSSTTKSGGKSIAGWKIIKSD